MLADAYAQATDPATGKIDYNKLTSLVAAGGGGAQLPGIQKLRTEQSAAETKLQKDQADLLDAKLKQSRGFLDTIDPTDPTAPARYLAWHEANHKDPIIGAALTARGVSVDQARQNIEAAIAKGPAAFAQLLNQSKLGTEKFMEMNRPTMQVVDQSGQRQVLQFPGLGGAGTSVGTYPDMPLPKAVEEQKARIALAGRPPPQPRAESPLVAIIGPDGSPILVSRENAVGKTPANMAEKPMTQAQRVKYTKDKVSDKDVVTGAFAVTGELEKLTDELVGNPDKKIAPAPGLSSLTGFSALTNPLALPSGDARKALQKLETFKGKIMALGRQLASQEGKLGNMAVQEWKFVSDAVQKIDPAAGNLDVQMRDVVRQAREYSQRQQAKYDDTYADDLATQGGGTAPAAVGANVVVTPDGRSHTFPTPAAAAAFKKAAGL